MKNFLTRYRQKRRIISAIWAQMADAVGMNHWGRAHNLSDRLRRVKGQPPAFSLARYQVFKKEMALQCGRAMGFQQPWEFDPYTLS